MAGDVPAELRRLVSIRANDRCEYCLTPQAALLHKNEPDHIVPRQHGGQTEEGNLALACLRCNRYKGPNIGSLDSETDQLVASYNPRTQDWFAHFEMEGAIIRPLTPEARVTVKILRLNDDERVEERQRLIDAGIYD